MTLAFVNRIGTISKVILLLLMLHTSITKVNRLQLLSTTKFKNKKSRQYEKENLKKENYHLARYPLRYSNESYISNRNL